MNKLCLVLIILSTLLLAACESSVEPSWLQDKYMSAASRYITIDGNRVHCRDEGKGNGEVLVLIHGTASSLHTWDQWVEKLTDRYRIIRMDLPGFGLTGPDRDSRYEVKDDVAFLYALFDKLNVTQAHLVGSSLGGRIAWQFALEHPDRVQTLTLMNALGYPQESWPPPIEMAQWPVIDTVMAYVSPRFMYEFGLKDVYYDASLVNDELVDRYYELSRYPGNLAAFPARVKARLDQDSSLIKGIRVPTLIQWGQEDIYFPVSSAYRFQKDIEGSQLHVYPDVGHLPMEEAPNESLQHFLSFIDRRGLEVVK